MNKKTAVFNKMIKSIDDFLNITLHSSNLISDEIYFEYPFGIYWSVIKSSTKCRVFLYPDSFANIHELIESFDDYEADRLQEQPRMINFDDIDIDNKAGELYESLINRIDGGDDLYDKILSF